MKRVLLAAAAVALFAGPALANSCPGHMKAIDDALAKNPQLTAAQMTDVKKARAEGESLHKAGKHADSVKELAKAEQILKIAK